MYKSIYILTFLCIIVILASCKPSENSQWQEAIIPDPVYIGVEVPSQISASEFDTAFDKDGINSGDCGDGTVDQILSTDIEGGICVAGLKDQGEWLIYDIYSRRHQKMDLKFRVATNDSSRALKIKIDNKTVGIVNISGTDSYFWQDATLKAIEISEGNHQLKIEWMTDSINLNYITFTIHELHGTTSELWGNHGESYDPRGLLSDWSYAGYHWGEKDPPNLEPTLDVVRDFDAIANDDYDDTQAFIDALASANYGDVILVPAGKFIISNVLSIPSGVVLKGKGSEKTTIYIPTNLVETTGIDPSFTGGFIEMKGTENPTQKITDVIQFAERGSNEIVVGDTRSLEIGNWVLIKQGNGEVNFLLDTLYGGYSEGLGDYSNLLSEYPAYMEFYSRITRIESNVVTLERSLPIDISPEFSAELHQEIVLYSDVGLEGITIEFPETEYPGHFNEEGYNAIDMNAQHSWVRDIVVRNIDYGINLRGSHFVSIIDFSVINANNRSAHHGISVGFSTDCLIRGFDIQGTLVHDLTIEWYSHSNVFTQGRGEDINLDHHKGAPYSNLFSQINIGKATRPWRSGGRFDRGYNTAVYSTFWNLDAEVFFAWPPNNFGPLMTFIGMNLNDSNTSNLSWYNEEIPPSEIYPPNLWISQREKRLNRQ